MKLYIIEDPAMEFPSKSGAAAAKYTLMIGSAAILFLGSHNEYMRVRRAMRTRNQQATICRQQGISATLVEFEMIPTQNNESGESS